MDEQRDRPGDPWSPPDADQVLPPPPGAAAGSPTDASGAPTDDAGSPTADAGAPTDDAGSPTADAGSPKGDAGSPTGDAGSPPQPPSPGPPSPGSSPSTSVAPAAWWDDAEASGVMRIETDEPSGPPPPPFAVRRRRRRNLAIVAVVTIIGGIPLVLGIISNASGDGALGTTDDDAPVASPDDDAAEGDDGEAPDDGTEDDGTTDGGTTDPDASPGDDGDLDRPDPGSFDGVDAVYAELLGDIDASELAMMGFQDALSGVFGGLSDPDGATERIQDAASEAQGDLLGVRERLVDELPDEGAEAVRAVYLDHLDSWADYMGAVEQSPGMLGSEDRTRSFILAINVTADAFARTLEQELPDDVDAEVRRFADDILDRGFRGFGEANV